MSSSRPPQASLSRPYVGWAVWALLTTGCLNLSPDNYVFACPTCADAGLPDEPKCDCLLPAPTCEGNARLEAQSARCTEIGGCRYSGVWTECPDGCANGACKGDTCLGVTCQSPPPAVCVNPTTLKYFQRPGTCFGGGCSYLPVELSCACADGSCVSEPCQGVTCNRPPPAFCNGNTLRSFPANGSCSPKSGDCHYVPVDTSCPNGCLDGQCLQALCSGVSCISPPANSCSTNTSVVTYAPTGTCQAGTGQCSYVSSVRACEDDEVCSNGKCGTPLPQCNPSNCAGCCSGTACIAMSGQTDMGCGSSGAACAACGVGAPQCKAGVCTSLCSQVTCASPPAATCMGSTLRSYANPGTCAPTTGICAYPQTDTSCASGCNNGVCNGSLCTGVSCNSAPTPTCFNATSRRVYTTPGTCAAATGQCSYGWTQQPCPSNHACNAGQCQINPPMGTVEQIASSEAHSCAIRSDNTLWCWGSNAFGQIGDGATINRSSPTQVAGTQWTRVGVGFTHSCALDSGGKVWCWGDNERGKLGDDSTVDHITPKAVAGGHWVFVAAGGWQSCAVQDDQTLWCWGSNYYQQLGLGDAVDRDTPTRLQGNTWAKVAIGTRHMCAIELNGTMWCWGYNEFGMVGDGSTFNRSLPVQISAGPWESVSLGARHTCAIKTDRTLWCWGYNIDGQLGDGTTSQRNSPVQIPGTTWERVGAGVYHTCAVKTDGTLWCWGDNEFSTVGDGTTVDRLSPTQIPGTTWRYPGPGEQHSCVTKTDGSAWCWGRNNYGQLGIGSTANSTVPVRMPGT